MKKIMGFILVLFVLLSITQVSFADEPVLYVRGCIGVDHISLVVTNFGRSGLIGHVIYTNDQYVYESVSENTPILILDQIESGETITFTIPLEYQDEMLIGVYKDSTSVWQYDLSAIVYPQNFGMCNQDESKESVNEESVCFDPPEAIEVLVFEKDTQLLWDATVEATTGVYIKAGQTAKVVQYQDEFAQIVWACQPLWVEVGEH